MGSESKESWLSPILDQLDSFYQRLEEKIEKEEEQLKASKKKTELETKLAQEMKLHNELTERLAELSRRGNELDRVCAANPEFRLTIADSDQNRLDNAKEMYQLGKELTGVRLNFSASPDVCKGYIKCVRRKQLLAFEFPASKADAALWPLLQSVFVPEGNENMPINVETNRRKLP